MSDPWCNASQPPELKVHREGNGTPSGHKQVGRPQQTLLIQAEKSTHAAMPSSNAEAVQARKDMRASYRHGGEASYGKPGNSHAAREGFHGQIHRGTCRTSDRDEQPERRSFRVAQPKRTRNVSQRSCKSPTQEAEGQ